MAEQVSFDSYLYLPEAVEAAAAAYAEHADIALTTTPEAVLATISGTGDDADLHTLTHAFCNHVLHETIARKRRAAAEER
ncbi:HxsD-like protein [Candidatus Binatia bacterium]|nr:HxsD-like protein [Candidatus Binatia bacterium]